VSNGEGWYKLSRIQHLESGAAGTLVMHMCFVRPIEGREEPGEQKIPDWAYQSLVAGPGEKALGQGSLDVEVCGDQG